MLSDQFEKLYNTVIAARQEVAALQQEVKVILAQLGRDESTCRRMKMWLQKVLARMCHRCCC